MGLWYSFGSVKKQARSGDPLRSVKDMKTFKHEWIQPEPSAQHHVPEQYSECDALRSGLRELNRSNAIIIPRRGTETFLVLLA